jgi:DNA modification methylase
MADYRNIAEIKPNPKNPRVIKDDKFAKLVESLRSFPEMLEKRPLVCVTDIDGKVFPLGGNMRLKAANELKMKELPVVMADDWTEEQRQEFIIKDNVGFGEWNWDELQSDWDVEQLGDWGLDIPQQFKVEAEAEEDEFDVPEGGIETDIVLGDLFEIGEHRLLCGDSTDSDAVAMLMDGQNADMLTDPPYGIDINMNMGRLRGQPKKFEEKNWDKSVPDFFYLLELFENKIIWGGNYFADKLPVTKDWLCWSKKTKGLDFAEFELAWTNTGKNARILEHHWSGEKKLHPTMKPVPVIAWCLEYLHSENIFDPFLGSGSTMVAAHQLKRKCYGMELDPKYCQVIIDRMLKLDPNLVIKRNGEAYLKTDVKQTQDGISA